MTDDEEVELMAEDSQGEIDSDSQNEESSAERSTSKDEPDNSQLDEQAAQASQTKKLGSSARYKLFKTHKEKIDELDDQMYEKLQQLHDEMWKQGMRGAADLLQDCFDPEEVERREKRQAKKKEISMKDKKQGKSTRLNNQAENLNSNHVIKHVQSEETIYENAVQKRPSTSSEENFDTSDESLNNLNNDVFHLAGPSQVETPVAHKSMIPDPMLTTSGEPEMTVEQRADDVI